MGFFHANGMGVKKFVLSLETHGYDYNPRIQESPDPRVLARSVKKVSKRFQNTDFDDSFSGPWGLLLAEKLGLL